MNSNASGEGKAFFIVKRTTSFVIGFLFLCDSCSEVKNLTTFGAWRESRLWQHSWKTRWPLQHTNNRACCTAKLVNFWIQALNLWLVLQFHLLESVFGFLALSMKLHFYLDDCAVLWVNFCLQCSDGQQSLPEAVMTSSQVPSLDVHSLSRFL